jgi:chromate reductase
MPVMQHPEAYLGQVSDEDFNADGLLKEGRTEEFVRKIADAFADWVHLIHEARSLLAR